MARKRASLLRGLKVVITAGPTREHIDAVRFLTNASTGRMGIEMAKAAAHRGARVTLVLGPIGLEPPAGVRSVPVVSTAEMLKAARAAVQGADLAVFAAAPADWRPVRRRRGKPARTDEVWRLELTSTQDIAATLGRHKHDRLHVGFALEVARGEKRAREKLTRKRFDAIVLNTPANIGRGGGRASWITEGDKGLALPTSSKPVLAYAILDHVEDLLHARATE